MMKSKISTIALYAGFFMLIVIVATAIKSWFEPPPRLVTTNNVEKLIQIRDDSISYWKDKYNQEHAEKRLAEGQIEELQLVYGPLIDTVKEMLDIQASAIKNLTAVGITNSGQITARVDTYYVDSTRHLSFNYNDKWLNVSGSLSDLARLKYTSRDSLIVTAYTKKTGFLGLGKKETYIDAYSLNPNSKITGLTGLMVLKERQKRFGLGPFVGIGWSGNSIVPTVGVGLNYSLIKF